MKIAIIGTHGIGKTTLSFSIAHHLKEKGINLKVIQEVARECPYPINEGMTKAAALWIFHEHSKKELDALVNHKVIISDRSIIDSLIYAKYFQININSHLEKYAKGLLSEYDKLIFVRPDIPLQGDGIRSENFDFQIGIDKLFCNILEDSYNVVQINASQIFDQEESWKNYCLPTQF